MNKKLTFRKDSPLANKIKMFDLNKVNLLLKVVIFLCFYSQCANARPIHEYSFESYCDDDWGKNDGNAINTQFSNILKKQGLYAVGFSGDNSYINIGNLDFPLQGSPFSISIWVNPEITETQWKSIMHVGDKSAPKFIEFRATNGKFSAVYYDGNSTHEVNANSNYVTNQWYNLIMTFDGATLKFFVNGVPQNNGIGVSIAMTYSQNLRLDIARCYEQRPTPLYWQGRVDDITIYDHVLSQSDMSSIVTTLAIQKSMPIHKYDLDNNSLDAIHDNDGVSSNVDFDAVNKVEGSHSVHFNGLNSFINVDNISFPLANSSFSLSTWVRPEIISGVQWKSMMHIGDKNAPKFIEFRDVGGKFSAIYYNGSSDTGVESKSIYVVGNWYHLVIAYDGTYLSFYMNSILQGKVAVTMNYSSSLRFDVGKCYEQRNVPLFWQGTVDEIQIFNKGINQEEVSQIYRTYSSYLFFDNFSNGSSQWSSSSKWNAANMQFNFNDNTSTDDFALAGSSKWSDYYMQVTVRPVVSNTPGDFSFGTCFRYNDWRNMYRFYYSGAMGCWNLIKKQNGDIYQLNQGDPFSLDYNKDYTLRIYVHGQSIKCYVNGVMQCVSMDDASFPAGKIGLQGYNIQASFDNVYVSGKMPDWRDVDNAWFSQVAPWIYHDTPKIVIGDDNSWVVTYTTGDYEEALNEHIAYKKSYDGGLSWSCERSIEPTATDPLTKTVSAFSYLYKDTFGRLYSFYRFNDTGGTATDQEEDARGNFYFRFSDDHGENWSAHRYLIPTRLTDIDNPISLYGWLGGYGPVAIDGVLWLPGAKANVNATTDRNSYGTVTECWYWKSSNILTERDPTKISWSNSPAGNVGLNYSSDGGGHRIGEEPSIVKLSNGTLYMVIRTYGKNLACSYSTDNGNSWSIPTEARYADNSGIVNNNRFGAILSKLSDGTYVMTYSNDAGESSTPGRNPMWLTVGFEEGNVLKFAQPELLFFNDRSDKGSAGAPSLDIYMPTFFETNGKLYNIYAVRKTAVNIQEVSWDLIRKIKNQRTESSIRIQDLSLWLSAKDYVSGEIIPPHEGTNLRGVLGNSPDNSTYNPAIDGESFVFAGNNMITMDGADDQLQFDNLNRDGSFTFEFWVQFNSLVSNQTLIDTRNSSGAGIVIRTTENGGLEGYLSDKDGRVETLYTGINSFYAGQYCHVVLIVDGSSDVAYFVIDGVIKGDNNIVGADHSSFKEISHELSDVNSKGAFYIGHQSPDVAGTSLLPLNGKIDLIRIYNRSVLTSEAKANYNAGRSQ